MSQHLRFSAFILSLPFLYPAATVRAEEPSSAVVQQVATSPPMQTDDGFTPVPEATPGNNSAPPEVNEVTTQAANPPAVTVAAPRRATPSPQRQPSALPYATAPPASIPTGDFTSPAAPVRVESTVAAPAKEPEPQLTAEMHALRAKIRRVLGYYYVRPDDTTSHSPWGVMHSMLPFGVDADILDNGQRKNAIGFLCYNGKARGRRLLYVRNGEVRGNEGPGVQGHPGQFLAMLAQSRVKSDYPLQVNDSHFTVEDLVRTEMNSCKAGTELTFKLIGLSHYLDSNATWRSRDGETWNIQRLIREEMRQQINGAACGGIHRLMGLSYAVNRRRLRGEPVTGEWAKAQYFVNRYMSFALRMQNRDASFSTGWFEERGADTDMERRLYTTGHVLEWLVFSAPDHQLDDYRIKNGVNYLANLLSANRNVELPIGPKGHALRALSLYDQRQFGGQLGLGGGRELLRQAQLSSTLRR